MLVKDTMPLRDPFRIKNCALDKALEQQRIEPYACRTYPTSIP